MIFIALHKFYKFSKFEVSFQIGMSVIQKDTTAVLIIEIELTTRTVDFENRFYTDKRKSLFIFSASSCKEVYEENG